MPLKLRLTVTLIVALLLVACQSQPDTVGSSTRSETSVQVDGGTYTDISPAGLAEMLPAKDFLFVNTHIPYEGEIAATDAFIAFEESGPQRVSEYPADKSAKIVLYCRSGRMSTIVAEELVAAGYTDVWNLDGGMIAWEEAESAIDKDLHDRTVHEDLQMERFLGRQIQAHFVGIDRQSLGRARVDNLHGLVRALLPIHPQAAPILFDLEFGLDLCAAGRYVNSRIRA